jgi:shikimate dehydrogenase
MQNAGMAALGLNWRYLACDVYPSHLREAIAGAKAMKFVGLNLTVPHKVLALDQLDVLDDSARLWGAVNTIRFEAKTTDGSWCPVGALPDPIPEEIRAQGFNTDGEAILRSLREDLGLEPAGARVLLVGTGGAGRVAALKLAAEGVAQLYLVNRTVSKAEAVAAEIRERYPAVSTQVGYPGEGVVDLVLNATSLGLKGEDPLPLDTRQFSLQEARAVYDMNYRPAKTLLLGAAEAAGCRVANGVGMLLYQGAWALEIWSGARAPVDVMRQALMRHIYGH